MNKKTITILTVISVVLAIAAYITGNLLNLERIYRSLIMAPSAILIIISFAFATKLDKQD